MNGMLVQYSSYNRAEIALISSYEDNLEVGKLIEFLTRVCTVCNDTNSENNCFGSWVTKITKHYFQPTLLVEELLLAHLADDAIWDNTNPYKVSFDTTDDAEITTSIHVTKESTVTTTISMSNDDDKPWFDVHKEFDLWYNTPETMDNYKEWEELPNILKNTSIINESLNKHIVPDFILANVKPKYRTFKANYFTVYYWISFPPVHVHQVLLSHVIVYI